MRFVDLHDLHGQVITVNSNKISVLADHQSDEGYTSVKIDGSYEFVKETVDEIKTLIGVN